MYIEEPEQYIEQDQIEKYIIKIRAEYLDRLASAYIEKYEDT